MKFLNQAMASFDATVVMPVNFVLFTLSAILSGVAFYQEFDGLTALQLSMFLLGASFSLLGVWFITSGRNQGSVGGGGDKEDMERWHLVESFPAVPGPLIHRTELSPFPHDVRPVPSPPPPPPPPPPVIPYAVPQCRVRGDIG